MADGLQLVDELRVREEFRHRPERQPAKVLASPATITRVPRSANSSTHETTPSPRNWASSIPTTSGPAAARRSCR
jgi:hypothetical protein